MMHLVLWYGYENVPEKYGLANEFISYDEAKQEGLHNFNEKQKRNRSITIHKEYYHS